MFGAPQRDVAAGVGRDVEDAPGTVAHRDRVAFAHARIDAFDPVHIGARAYDLRAVFLLQGHVPARMVEMVVRVENMIEAFDASRLQRRDDGRGLGRIDDRDLAPALDQIGVIVG